MFVCNVEVLYWIGCYVECVDDIVCIFDVVVY